MISTAVALAPRASSLRQGCMAETIGIPRLRYMIIGESLSGLGG